MATITEVRDSLTALLTKINAFKVSITALVEARAAAVTADNEAELQVLKEAIDTATAEIPVA